jgi:HD superfamily phosphohydrolase
MMFYESKVRGAERNLAAMENMEWLKQGLFEVGCSEAAAGEIIYLYENGNCEEALRQMKKQRCSFVEEMHKSQRRVDRMDYLIREQEKNRLGR